MVFKSLYIKVTKIPKIKKSNFYGQGKIAKQSEWFTWIMIKCYIPEGWAQKVNFRFSMTKNDSNVLCVLTMTLGLTQIDLFP